MGTHEVPNQPPPLPELDLFTTDPVLPMAVERHDAGWAIDQLQAFGQRVGSAEVAEWAVLFRESPLNAICEGSGNVIALDLLRAWPRNPVLPTPSGPWWSQRSARTRLWMRPPPNST